MAHSVALEEKIKAYLSGLTPKAVEAVVRNLERAALETGGDARLNLVLSTAQELLRHPMQLAPEIPGGNARKANIQRMFFAPLNSFVINEYLPTYQEGRINRAMLDKVWAWIKRDVLPGDVKVVLSQAANPAVSGERVDALVHALRARAVDAIGRALRQAEVSDKQRRRIAIELGGERGISELRDIHKILEAESWLLPFLNTIPDTVNEQRLKNDIDVLKMVDKCSRQHPDHMPMLAAALIDRAEAPSAICAFAGRLAGSNDPKTIAASQFAPFVDVVMSEAERLQILAKEHRDRNPDPVAFSEALSDYHKLVRGVERDFDLSVTGNWQRRLADTKRSISDVVGGELNAAHGAVRRALQVPKVGADGQFKVDQASIDEAVRSLRVVVMVRNASETLAVNDIAKRTRQTVEQTMEILTRALITDLGKARGQQRDAHLSAVDTAIMLSEIFFGVDYAAQLKRSRQAALSKSQDADNARAAAKPAGAQPPKVLRKA